MTNPTVSSRRVSVKLLSLAAASVSALLFFTACETSSSSASPDRTQTTQVGTYSPPPRGIEAPRVGVPAFEVDNRRGATESMNTVAADILTTLAANTGRFRVIERAQLTQLTREQGLEGIVQWDEVTEMGQVRGVDYLILGKVTNFRLQATDSRGGVGIGQTRLPFGGAIGAFDLSNRNARITAEVGVDLRLVNPATGEVLAANFSEFNRTDSVSGFGVQILGVRAESDANLEVSEDDQGRILRLALDDALRKMLPAVDNALRIHHSVAPGA
jgi:curli biogenesis system outer membrane secretion channel CsgG